MANTPQPQRQDEPAVTDADLDALLAGEADAIPGLRPVADVLAALAAGPTAGELAGETRTLTEFRRRAGAPVPRQRARRGTAMLPSRLGAKIGVGATAVAIVFGGAATAAFANALPAPIQRLAHDAFGAPTPQPPRDLPGHGAPGAHGQRAHGQAAARGEPRGGRQARPHATAAPTPPGNPHPKGQQGNPHGHGKPSSQGQQGNGQGDQGNGQGNQGNGKGNQGNGKGNQGNGKGKQGNEQGGNGHAAAQHGNFHGKGLRGGRPAHHRPAATRAGPYIPKPAMDP